MHATSDLAELKRRLMNKSVYLLIFILALTVAYATPQTPSQTQPTQSTSQPSQTGQPGHSSTNGQSGSLSPAQNTSPASVPAGVTGPSGAAVTGSAAANTGKTQVTENPQSTAARLSDSDLQSQIQQALSKEPTLAGDAVTVKVSARTIDVSGKVGNPKQELTATRIVQSYAENRKVENHLTIGSTSSNAAAPAAAGNGNQANPPDRPDLSSHPEPEKGSPPGTSTRPPE